MEPNIKTQLLERARQHLAHIRERIQQTIRIKELQTTSMSKDSIKMMPGDALAQMTIVAHNQERTENLKQLYPSPYFTKCEFEVAGEKKIMYFSKFSFGEENIYSWITPAAALRFENLGQASYTRPDGKIQSGTLHSKDQYMIVDGALIFYATESINVPRELVYQEHFTTHKHGFVLPDVVEQMEKAQDQVVRAHFHGPFVISGPAGSGKTTLALHRVAYLSQSPETAEYFKPENTLVLVQDKGTKEYFSHLLPELGIKGVAILTFAEWATTILNLEDFTFTSHHSNNDTEQINYEFEKISILKTKEVAYNKNVYSVLNKLYENNLSANSKKLWQKQRQEKTLDRLDITILLQAFKKTRGEFALEKEYYEELANGHYRKRRGSFPASYNLMVVDEFQNYLPEQLAIMRSCLNHRLDSIIYVGDLAQQTQLGTVRDWTEIGEQIQDDRLITLQKVYRNTKEILTYIKKLGFNVTIPKEIKPGKAVIEKILSTPQSEIEYIQTNIADLKDHETAGIITKDKSYTSFFKSAFPHYNVLCLSYQEAQGVEFDRVFIVGVHKDMFTTLDIPTEMISQTKKIQKDLLYVALTRAMSEMHVLGKENLSAIDFTLSTN